MHTLSIKNINYRRKKNKKMKKILIAILFVLLAFPMITDAETKFLDTNNYRNYYIDTDSIHRYKDYITIDYIIEPCDSRGMFYLKATPKYPACLPNYTVITQAFTYDGTKMSDVEYHGYNEKSELIYHIKFEPKWQRVAPQSLFGTMANYVINKSKFLNIIARIFG